VYEKDNRSEINKKENSNVQKTTQETTQVTNKQQTLFDYMANENTLKETDNEPSLYSNKESTFKEWEDSCRKCTQCVLHEKRTQSVFGEGNPSAQFMLVGEAPGADEDKQGLPFVGNAGKLLNNILKAINVCREEVYITNVVKCRPPGNRLPQTEEVNQCFFYLNKQLEIINPFIILCLGSLSTRSLIDPEFKITQVRGNWYEKDSRWYMPTFHPAALLRDPKKKKPVWEDFQKVKAFYDKIKNR